MPVANNGSFDDLVASAEGAEVMYRENGLTDEIVEDRVEMARHRSRFDQLWEAALNEGDTIALIQARIEVLTTTRTRGGGTWDS